ncbi:MAG: hypothetical protein C9356_17195 [Oleiphilus sp.]|nr:MAG: hypothetical protein C9356_17195 [Oleiphilus sp.]
MLDQLLSWYQEPMLLKFPVYTMLLSVGAFLLLALPWTLLAWFDPPWARPYKAQDKPFEVRRYIGKNLRLIAGNSTLVLLIFLAAWPVVRLFGIHDGPRPPWYEFVWQITLFFILDDFLYYWMHRKMHENKWLLKNVHSVHHQVRNPSAIAGNYFHWIELLFTAGLVLVGPILLSSHIEVVYVWLFLRQWQAVDGHTGYQFRWNPLSWLPFYHGAKFHDLHHETYKGNYAGFFPIWDRVFGTETRPGRNV